MKPTIGRIVHYKTRDSLGYEQTLPAIVLVVHSDTCVNLQVFGINAVETSVCMGDDVGSWSWPPRA